MRSITKFIFALICVLLESCGQPPPAKPAQAPEKAGNIAVRTKQLDPAKVPPPAIRHDNISDAQVARIAAIQKTLAEVDHSPLDKWVDDFSHELHPDREITLYEAVVNAYQKYCAPRKLSIEAKKEVYNVLLTRSMTNPEEALVTVELQYITKAAAIEAMDGFEPPPPPVRSSR